MDKVERRHGAIIENRVPDQLYSKPLPQVLILTAIVVRIATSSTAAHIGYIVFGAAHCGGIAVAVGEL